MKGTVTTRFIHEKELSSPTAYHLQKQTEMDQRPKYKGKIYKTLSRKYKGHKS